MPYRLNPSHTNQFYHVYNRGNNREKIFYERKNYLYFMKKLVETFNDNLCLIAYCLMPNHYHLVVLVNKEGELEKAMQKISTGYTRAINKAYKRTGHLFTGRYRNKLIPGDSYLLHLCRYIHLNPVRAGLVKDLDQWEFSSYNNYLKKVDRIFINTEIFTEYFKSLQNFIEFHKSFQDEQNYYVKPLLFS